MALDITQASAMLGIEPKTGTFNNTATPRGKIDPLKAAAMASGLLEDKPSPGDKKTSPQGPTLKSADQAKEDRLAKAAAALDTPGDNSQEAEEAEATTDEEAFAGDEPAEEADDELETAGEEAEEEEETVSKKVLKEAKRLKQIEARLNAVKEREANVAINDKIAAQLKDPQHAMTVLESVFGVTFEDLCRAQGIDVDGTAHLSPAEKKVAELEKKIKDKEEREEAEKKQAKRTELISRYKDDMVKAAEAEADKHAHYLKSNREWVKSLSWDTADAVAKAEGAYPEPKRVVAMVNKWIRENVYTGSILSDKTATTPKSKSDVARDKRETTQRNSAAPPQRSTPVLKGDPSKEEALQKAFAILK